MQYLKGLKQAFDDSKFLDISARTIAANDYITALEDNLKQYQDKHTNNCYFISFDHWLDGTSNNSKFINIAFGFDTEDCKNFENNLLKFCKDKAADDYSDADYKNIVIKILSISKL